MTVEILFFVMLCCMKMYLIFNDNTYLIEFSEGISQAITSL